MKLNNNTIGQSVIEYALMLAVVVVVLIVAIHGPVNDSLHRLFGETINAVNENVRSASEGI